MIVKWPGSRTLRSLVVIRVAKGKPHLEVHVDLVPMADAKIFVRKSDYAKLGVDEKSKGLQVRKKTPADGLRNLAKEGSVAALAALVLAVVAVLPVAVWPAPSTSVTDKVTVISSQLAMALGAASGTTGALLRQLSALEAESAQTVAVQERDHSRAEEAQAVAAVLFAAMVGIPAVVKIYRGR